jgi:hypothetical protein
MQHDPLTSEFAWHEPRNNTSGNDQGFTSTPKAPATTPWTPSLSQRPVNNQNGDFQRRNTSSLSPEYVPMFVTIQNDEISSLAHFSSFLAQESVSQEDSTAEPKPLPQCSTISSELQEPPTSPTRAQTSLGMAAQNSLTVQWHNDNSSGAESRTAGTSKPKRKSGGRKGRMKPDNARKAHATRKRGACFHCWAHKVPVSPGALRNEYR